MHEVSVGTAIVLLITYAAGLWFTFRTHSHLLSSGGGGHDHDEDDEPLWPMRRAALTLAAASIALVVWRGRGVLVGAAILLAIGYAVARIPLRIAWSQVRPVRWMLLVIGLTFIQFRFIERRVHYT